MMTRFRDQAPPDLGQSHAYGRHLSQIVCAECHNSSLHGFEGFTPNLDIAGTYDAAELETLLTTGKGKAKPDLGLMSLSAKDRFAKLTPGERSAIIAYVKARADGAQPAGAN
jgi:mono/diheme cytochrome c family protein